MVDRWDDGSYTLEGAAAVIGVHPRTIYTWISRGMLDARQPFKHAPWKINLSEERIRELRDYLSQLTLPPLEAAGFLLHSERPTVAGLTLAPQAFNLSVCPTARRILIPSSLMFFAAL